MDIIGIFSKAATSTTWTQTNLGKVAEVTHQDLTWTVLLPGMGTDEAGESTPSKARITGYQGYGGTEFMEVEATWAQTIGIVDAALAATRI
ncbi:hypothetical protein ACFOOM_01060 [Streptomyces echinoruber]|uniref:Uncharacterized protein n=1 Tax=Streptomyces echinoruber TaxID=68898 RepID=A0A918V5J2_9ACTN|nr:hypothetical protein [Streptomyces echinoruber]GGZ73112.1 hypothetical protein GCM10010389_08220 [Streptomyces echinoruber]